MSYIVCSNQQRGYTNTNTGIQDPNTFKNFFKSPLIIEPNSEIAVESIKFNRPYVWEVKENALFYLYFGKELVAGYGQPKTPRTSVPVYISAGNYTPQEMAQEIQRAINVTPIHPQTFNNVRVTATFGPVSREFVGFDFQFTAIGAGTEVGAAKTYPDLSAGANQLPGTRNSTFGATLGYTWDDPASSFTFTCGARSALNPAPPAWDPARGEKDNVSWNPEEDSEPESCSILTAQPLSNGSTANGRSIFEVQIQDNGAIFKRTDDTQWAVGLTRPTIPTINNGAPPITQTHGEAFYDYVVRYDPDEGGIFVEEFNTGDFQDDPRANLSQLRKREIEYWSAIGGAPFAGRITHTEINASTLDSVRWILVGDQVKLAIGTSGGTFYDLVDFDNSKLEKDRESNFKPLNNNTEALYPKVEFTGVDRDNKCTMEVKRMEVLNPVADFGLFNYPTQNASTGKQYRGSDFYSSFVKTSVDRLASNNQNLVLLTDNRPCCQANDITNVAKPFAYIINHSDPNGGSVLYNHVIIQNAVRGNSNITEEDNLAYLTRSQAGATFVGDLGWGNVQNITQSEFGTEVGGDAKVVNFAPPAHLPVIKSGSLFVRVPNLEQISYNGATTGISKILYHVPAFDNAGRSHGQLFHAPNERTYIKLNNTEKVVLPELDTDFVDRFERIPGNLIDNTTVCYHIRKSRN